MCAYVIGNNVLKYIVKLIFFLSNSVTHSQTSLHFVARSGNKTSFQDLMGAVADVDIISVRGNVKRERK